MTNETPDTLKQLRQILEKQSTANDDITGNSRNHWRKIATKGLTRGRFKNPSPKSLVGVPPNLGVEGTRGTVRGHWHDRRAALFAGRPDWKTRRHSPPFIHG
jgi:hypothetical protein